MPLRLTTVPRGTGMTTGSVLGLSRCRVLHKFLSVFAMWSCSLQYCRPHPAFNIRCSMPQLLSLLSMMKTCCVIFSHHCSSLGHSKAVTIVGDKHGATGLWPKLLLMALWDFIECTGRLSDGLTADRAKPVSRSKRLPNQEP